MKSSNQNILGIIPARGGSKGIYKKNIKLLNGKPLIWYTFSAALSSRLLTRTIVSSDDDDILRVCKELGMDIPFKRPADLGRDDTPTLPVILHAIESLEKIGEHYDAVCLLQPTTPLRSPNLIDNAIKLFLEKKADSLITVRMVPPEYNPHWAFELDKDHFLHISTGEETIIPRRQELPNAYIRDGALYITKVEIIKHRNSVYGRSIAYIEHNHKHHVNLDNIADWEKAKKIFMSKDI